MAQPPDSSPNAASQGSLTSSGVERLYGQAVEAFKSKDYARALILFQRLGKLPDGSAYRLKGLMGQVRVHQRVGQRERARSICLELLKSKAPAVRQWAQAALAAMPEGQGPGSLHRIQEAMPFPSNASGFVPLEPAAIPVLGSGPAIAANPTAPASSTIAEREATATSLFHFQRLNQDVEAPPLESNPTLSSPGEGANGQTAATAPAAVDPKPGTAPRLKVPPLPQRPLGLWVGQAVTAIAVVWAINWGFHTLLRAADRILGWVRLGLPGARQSYDLWVIGVLAVLLLANPWIFDYLLGRWYDQKPLSTRQLQSDQPEALRLLRQVCRQRDWQMPELRVVPTPAPLCFSYGWRAANLRIVVSQGVLEHFPTDAVVALYGYELARAANGSMAVMSWMSLLLLLLEHGHRHLAQWADRRRSWARNSLGLVASALYGLFWLLRQLGLGLSRLTSDWGDRRAVALTRQPGSLGDAWCHWSEAIAAHLRQRGTPHPLHISLEMIMPVGYRQALTVGGSMAKDSAAAAPPALIALDHTNPYRQWLRVSACHSPLGERLYQMQQYGALPLPPSSPSRFSLPLLLLQKAPMFGLLGGASLAMGLWFLGGVVNYFGWQRLSWLYQDSSLLTGGMSLGLGLGLLLRINALFPDPQTRPSAASAQAVASLIFSCQPLPVQGQPTTLQGTLRGATGVANWGCQDLYLEDASGVVRLIYPVPLGSLQGVWQPHHPCRWIGRRVTVTGWGRYGGGMLWVDADQVQLDNQRQTFRAYGPQWATAISLGISLIGILFIFRGG